VLRNRGLVDMASVTNKDIGLYTFLLLTFGPIAVIGLVGSLSLVWSVLPWRR